MVSDVLLSVVIPAHNEERRLRRTLPMIVEYLRSAFLSSEIIVSEDGSVDRTVDFVRKLSKVTERPVVRILSSPNRLGKGGGVRRGVFAAVGRYLILMDADLPVQLSSIERAVDELSLGADIVLGSRDLPESSRNEPMLRRLLGRGFHFLVRILFQLDFDTQCGFKAFRRESVLPLFQDLSLDSFAYDVELVSQALETELRIVELPVDYKYDLRTSVRFTDIPEMLLDLIRLRVLESGRKVASNMRKTS